MILKIYTKFQHFSDKITRTNHEFRMCEMLVRTMKFFEIVGIMQPKIFDSNLLNTIVYYLWSSIWWSLSIGQLLCFQTWGCIHYWPDLTRVFVASATIFSNIVTTMKLINAVYQRDLIYSHINYFKTENAEACKTDDEARSIVHKYEWMSYRDVSSILIVSAITIFTWACIGDLTEQPWGFPLVAWYPFNSAFTPLYQMMYVHQMGSLWICNMGLVSFFCSIK